jgi:Glucodextranase, domain B/FecR protein
MNKRIAFTVMFAIAFLALAGGAYYFLFLRTQPETMRIATVTGQVERKVFGSDWQTAYEGELLSVKDSIRTSTDSRVVLAMEDDSTVTVEDHTEVDVEELNRAVTKFRLTQGKLKADVRSEGGRSLLVSSRTGEITASSRGGAFAVMAKSDGSLAVATSRGVVDLASAGEAVSVEAGQQSVAKPGAAPSLVTKIPSSVFLKVDWPEEQITSQERIVIRGRTDVGARIVLNNKVVPVRADGSFEMEVDLDEGENELDVVAEDVAGNKASDQSDEIVRDSTAPKGRVETTNIWE